MSKHRHQSLSDRPLAAPGLISYRYPDNYGGWIMIGARDAKDALREANRSLSRGVATVDRLEVYTREGYTKVRP